MYTQPGQRVAVNVCKKVESAGLCFPPAEGAEQVFPWKSVYDILLQVFQSGNRGWKNLETKKGIGTMRKKRLLLLLLAGLMLCVQICAAAEGTGTVKFRDLVVPADAEEIDLGKISVGAREYQQFYQFLEQLPNLKRVDMFNTKITRERIAELVEKFPQIEFGWTMKVGDHLVRTDQTAFSTLHSDQSPRHSNADFSVLKYCKNLKALDIGHSAVTDLSFLYDLPELRVLIVVDNKFEDITPIGSLKKLEYLEIFYNNVRDITPLKGLDKLLDLNICWNRITDVSVLKEMTWLKRLWMSQYNDRNPMIKPDPAAVEEVRAALPDTQIDSTAKSSVGNHWRDHPHYKVLKQMFKTRTYIPFEDSWPDE